ncbi:MAG TPA: hypothetical protein VFE57_01365 [Cyclobacteriaceae bacterium]|nr:hypothetical protein [Cyclobacteriaceae bacterium]
MQRIIFESSPAFILLCIALGVGYAYFLYRGKYTWGKTTNQLLFGLRATLVALLAFLLIGPILKFTQNEFEKSTLIFLVDNSVSIKETVDSVHRQKLNDDILKTKSALEESGYTVKIKNLANEEQNKIQYTQRASDLAGAIRQIVDDEEGKNLSGVVLLSDGIYNSGASPLYNAVRFPIYTVGMGDTIERVDLVLKNLAYNKIAYQGNKFPLRAEVLIQGVTNQDVAVSVFRGGKLIEKQQKNSGTSALLDFDFQLDADEKGTQRLDVVVEQIARESNLKNNRASAFVEVVEGKKKILVIAAAPHPDIKALRSVLDKNSNYEFILHIPKIEEADASMLIPGAVDLVIFHNVLEYEAKTAPLFASLYKGPTPFLVMVGSKSNLRSLNSAGIPLTFESIGQGDEVTPVVNAQFSNFTYSSNLNSIFSKYPPVWTPFGRFMAPSSASILLYQQIGSVVTPRPLLFSFELTEKKIGVFMGEGIWRWRLNEYAATEKTEAFDELFTKLIQYLSTQEDKRKFRSFPIQHEFTDAEPVVIESQVYNDLFEPIYGNSVELEVRDEKGKISRFTYVTGPGSTRYRIGGLKEGIYKLKATTELKGKEEVVQGEFLVTAQNVESQNLTADFGLLRKVANNSGGKFYTSEQMDALSSDLQKVEAKSLIHSEDTFNPLINLKWLFFILLLLVSIEWFVRKYKGAY